jgi:ATPase family protein associated with various cellular activities (AAA)
VADTKKLGEVFKTVGLPPYTYVKPTYYGEVQADIEQPGKHVLIEGPSGVGKTCIMFKVFEEMSWTQGTQFQYVSCRDTDAEDKVNAFFRVASEGKLPEPPLIVIDAFHLVLTQRRADIGSSLKRLSDRAFEQASPPKAVLIGIPTTASPPGARGCSPEGPACGGPESG